MVKQVGADLAERVRDATLRIYKFAADYARERGILLADTKFEFGTDADGRLYIMDEMLTPDSSRYWPADEYEVGTSPPSYDKQFVRDYGDAGLGQDRPGPDHPGRDHRAHPRQVRRGAAAPGRDQRRLIRLRPRPDRRGTLKVVPAAGRQPHELGYALECRPAAGTTVVRGSNAACRHPPSLRGRSTAISPATPTTTAM